MLPNTGNSFLWQLTRPFGYPSHKLRKRLFDKSSRSPSYSSVASAYHSTSRHRARSAQVLFPQELSNTFNMSLDPPPYLSSIQNNIRARPIPWDGAVRAGTITDDQLSKIRAVDKVRKEVRKQTIEGDLDGYRTLFVGREGKPSVLQSAARRADVVQYILVLLGDLLDGVYKYLPT
jgi:hypothetical protein